MIYLGNQPVGVAFKQLIDGWKVDMVTIETAITRADALVNLVKEHVPADCIAFGVNATQVFNSSLPANNTCLYFMLDLQNDERVLTRSGYVRASSSSDLQFQSNMTSGYDCQIAVGDVLLIFYKEKEVA